MKTPWPRARCAVACAVVAAGGFVAAADPATGLFRLANPQRAPAPAKVSADAADQPAGGLLSSRWARGIGYAPPGNRPSISGDDESAQELSADELDRSEPAAMPAQQGEAWRHWSGPYEASEADVPPLGPYGYLPVGINPWGVRTPDRYRFVGLGEPLSGASWRNRPLAAGWFAGIIDGAPLTAAVDEHEGFFGGYRFGWDYDHYYGLEMRLGGAAIGLSDPSGAVGVRTADLFVWDVDWVYYPWGDARWRPFAAVGLGIVNVDFLDERQQRFDEVYLGIPLSLGVKYRCREWLVLRAEIVDNLAVGNSSLPALSDWSLTAGVEVRFGGLRKSYWPWYPSRHLW